MFILIKISLLKVITALKFHLEINFTNEEKQIILNLFAEFHSNRSTQNYLVNCFALETDKRFSFKTLQAQYQG